MIFRAKMQKLEREHFVKSHDLKWNKYCKKKDISIKVYLLTKNTQKLATYTENTKIMKRGCYYKLLMPRNFSKHSNTLERLKDEWVLLYLSNDIHLNVLGH